MLHLAGVKAVRPAAHLGPGLLRGRKAHQLWGAEAVLPGCLHSNNRLGSHASHHHRRSSGTHSHRGQSSCVSQSSRASMECI